MRIDVNGIDIEVQVEGTGRPVLLLHGFPDSGRLWRHQVAALRDAGFQTIVPDLRGYGATSKPEAVEQYGLLHIAGDVLGVLDHLHIDRTHVVGHDWGAALAWAIASFMPDRVDHLAVLSVGHPVAFRNAGLAQREKSWYMLLFQFQGIAEQWIRENNWAHFREWAGHPDADAVIDELERNGSLTPALNWYRANVHPESLLGPGLEFPPVQANTMGVWSDGDMALLESQMQDSARHVAGTWRYERVTGAGHWVQLDAPDRVNELLFEFLPR